MVTATLCKCLGIRGDVSLIPTRAKLILRGRQLRDKMCSTEGTKEGEGEKGFCKGGHLEALRAVQENRKQQKWILKWFSGAHVSEHGVEVPCSFFFQIPGSLDLFPACG